MQEKPYADLSPLGILALCCWREARGEPYDGKRGVCHVIRNRTLNPGWWGHDWHSVILKPYQFSSFNQRDPNSSKWPDDNDHSWVNSFQIAASVFDGTDEDLTEGATHYHDISIAWPISWGTPADYVNTLNVGRFKFYRESKSII